MTNEESTGGDPPPPQPACAAVPPVAPEPDAEPFVGALYHCEGIRSLRVDAEVCTWGINNCNSPKPIQDYDPPGSSGPLLTDEDLNVVQAFNTVEPLPQTGACCDPESEAFTAKGMEDTAQADCAARACLEVHDKLDLLAAITEFDFINAPDDSIEKNGLERAYKSMDFYVQVLEDPGSFANCTNGLAGEDHRYFFADAPIDGFGALKSLQLSNFECDMTPEPDEPGDPVDPAEAGFGCFLQEDPAPDPTTGGGGSTATACETNPNWFEGNAAESIIGSSVVSTGQVLLSAGKSPSFDGTSLAYRRALCADDELCLFVLTDLQFDLGDVKLGPVTFKAPHVVLEREATGAQFGSDVKIAAGQLVLRVESKIFVAGQPMLGGAMIPLWVSNDQTAHLQMIDGTIRIADSRFDLTLGGKANLSTNPSQCTEW